MVNLSSDPDPDPGFAVHRTAGLWLRGPRRSRVYWPGPGTAPALLVFFAVPGGLDGADTVCRGLCSLPGLVVLSAPCRSASPAAVADARDATEWAADHAAELDADPGRLLVAGQGTGGGLAAAVSLHARDRRWPAIVRQVLIHPDLAGTAAGDPYTSPCPAGVAPATVVTGDRDPLREDGRRYAARLRRAGVEVTELRHEAPFLTSPARVLRDLADALRHSLEPPQRRDTP